MAEFDIGKLFAEYQIDKIFGTEPPIPGKGASSSVPAGSGNAPIANETNNGLDDGPIDFRDAASTPPIATGGPPLLFGGGNAPYASFLTSNVEPVNLGNDHGWRKSGLFGDDLDWYLI